MVLTLFTLYVDMIFVGTLIRKIGSSLSSINNLFSVLVYWYLLTPVSPWFSLLSPCDKPQFWHGFTSFLLRRLEVSLLWFIFRGFCCLCLWFGVFLHFILFLAPWGFSALVYFEVSVAMPLVHCIPHRVCNNAVNPPPFTVWKKVWIVTKMDWLFFLVILLQTSSSLFV